MGHAKEHRNNQNMLSVPCKNALENVIRVADIGSNYRVDKVLYASCRSLIDGFLFMLAYLSLVLTFYIEKIYRKVSKGCGF